MKIVGFVLVEIYTLFLIFSILVRQESLGHRIKTLVLQLQVPLLAYVCFFVSTLDKSPVSIWSLVHHGLSLGHDFSYLYIWGAEKRSVFRFLLFSFVLNPFSILFLIQFFKVRKNSVAQVLWLFSTVIIFLYTKERPFWMWSIAFVSFNSTLNQRLTFKTSYLLWIWMFSLVCFFVLVPKFNILHVDSKISAWHSVFLFIRNSWMATVILGCFLSAFLLKKYSFVSHFFMLSLASFLFFIFPVLVFRERLEEVIQVSNAEYPENPIKLQYFSEIAFLRQMNWVEERRDLKFFFKEEKMNSAEARLIVPVWDKNVCWLNRKRRMAVNQLFDLCI